LEFKVKTKNIQKKRDGEAMNRKGGKEVNGRGHLSVNPRVSGKSGTERCGEKKMEKDDQDERRKRKRRGGTEGGQTPKKPVIGRSKEET